MTKNIKITTLIINVIAIIIASLLFIGVTFAWFSDQATSSGNKIQTGSLKVDLELLDPELGEWVSLKENSDPIFNYENWEPGYTDVKVLKIENEGNLALKWKTKFVSAKQLSKLADVIDVYVLASEDDELSYPTGRSLEGYARVGTVAEFVNTIESTTRGTLLGYDSAYLGIALKMRDGVGNEYQGLDLGGTFDIQITATQVSSEEDGFGNDYDSNANIIVDEGDWGGITWTLDDEGQLTVSPNGDGTWPEAVVYVNGSAHHIFEDPKYPNDKYPYDRTAVKSLVIEEGVTSIGSFTAQLPNLSGEVVIPSTVTYIGQEAFQKAPITKLTFAEGGTEPLCIAPGAFKQLAITELAFPADRPEIHLHCWVLNNCKKLETVKFTANITRFNTYTHVDYYGMDWVYGKYANSGVIFSGNSSLKTVVFPDEETLKRFKAQDNPLIAGVEYLVETNN